MRHGKTGPGSPLNIDEAALSQEGEEEVKKAATLLRGENVPQKIYASGKKRCVETARIVANILGLEKEVFIAPPLFLDSSISLEDLFLSASADLSLFVTHLPNLRTLLAPFLFPCEEPIFHPACLLLFEKEERTLHQIY